MSKRIFILILLIAIMSLLLAACNDSTPPTFQVNSSKEDVDVRSTYLTPETPIDTNAAQVMDVLFAKQNTGDTVIFYIYHPGGIGDASFALTDGKMPANVMARLFVDGLEHLELAYDDIIITASAPSHGDGPVTETMKKEGEEKAIDASTPYWIEIQALPAQEGGLFIGEPMLPASYLITLPEDFHKGGHTQFSLKWIDFYR